MNFVLIIHLLTEGDFMNHYRGKTGVLAGGSESRNTQFGFSTWTWIRSKCNLGEEKWALEFDTGFDPCS